MSLHEKLTKIYEEANILLTATETPVEGKLNLTLKEEIIFLWWLEPVTGSADESEAELAEDLGCSVGEALEAERALRRKLEKFMKERGER